MTEDEISEIFQVQNQFVFMKCEALVPARPVPIEQVEKLLVEAIRDKKLRLEAKDVFEELQKQTVVENIFNDPQKRKFPGVAAMINGHPITMEEAGRRVHRAARQGKPEGLDQPSPGRASLPEAQGADHAARYGCRGAASASIGVKPRPDGSPDVEAWRKIRDRPTGHDLGRVSARGDLAGGGLEEAGRR